MLDELPLDVPIPCRSAADAGGPDLHELLAPRPISTFFMRVVGHGLRRYGVLDGDLLVIDRAVLPQSGQLVVAEHGGRFLLRPLQQQGEQWFLAPVRRDEAPIPVLIDDLEESPLFGVAVHAIHHVGPAEGSPST
jgi:DNA polymerase V